MIVRVRTNVGVTRVEVDASVTIAELRRIIVQNLRIQGSSDSLSLSADLAGNRMYDDTDATLISLGIGQGCEIFVIGKFEKRVVDKAFVGEDSVIVPAGQTLIRIDHHEHETEPLVTDVKPSSVANEPDNSDKDPSVENKAPSGTQQTAELPATEPVTAPDPTLPSAPQATYVSSKEVEFPFSAADYDAMLQYEEDALRTPDEVQRMNLLHGSGSSSYDINHTEAGRTLMHAVLLPEVSIHTYPWTFHVLGCRLTMTSSSSLTFTLILTLILTFLIYTQLTYYNRSSSRSTSWSRH